jgi:hypothetical protein
MDPWGRGHSSPGRWSRCWPAHAEATRTSGPRPGPNPLNPTPQARPQIALFVGAGDIADCDAPDRGASAEPTAKLLDSLAGMVFTAGDNVYFNATPADRDRRPRSLRRALAPQDAFGRRDAFGIQQFIAGSGGAPLYDFAGSHPNSVFKLKAHGVLRLTLRDIGYDSVFIEAGTQAQHDPTVGTLCH